MTSHWPAPDGSKPYYTLARELGEPYRHIINYVEWIDARSLSEPTELQHEAIKYACGKDGLALRICRVWWNEQARRCGYPLEYDHLGDELK